MNYFVTATKATELLKSKYSARKIDMEKVTELFPCCGFENNRLVELKSEEKTIALYTDDEITEL